MCMYGNITIKVPNGSACGLFSGVPLSHKYIDALNKENEVKPTEITESVDNTVYSFSGLKPSIYHYGVYKEGYTSLCQSLNFTEEKAASGIEIDIKLEKLSGNGYEQGFLILNTEEFINAHLQSQNDTWGEEYSHLFNTPQFLRDGNSYAKHQQTTNEEIYNYIEKVNKSCENMYVFSLGKTQKYNFDMPLVLFTRENIKGKTLEQAAEIIRCNGKPTIQYAAQVHSNEPGSAEGALAMIGDLAAEFGKEVLEDVDVYIIPRINLDGAVEYIRKSPTTNEDMNRDYLRMNNREICMVNSAYNIFLPELVIDAHEKLNDALKTGESLCTDMELQTGAGSLNHPEEMTNLAVNIALVALKKARDIGLRAHFYHKLASAAGGCAGSSYYGTRNSLSFLVETPGGVDAGMLYMQRRVMAQYTLASSVIRYAKEHAKQVLDTVHKSRKKMVMGGSVYDENKLFVLNHGSEETGSFTAMLINLPDGKIIDENHTVPYSEHTAALRTRTRPTAYIIPKGVENEDEILRVLGCHAIVHYELPALSTVTTRQYLKAESEISLSDDVPHTFENGAYVFPNTVPSTVLSVIMEPDFNIESGRPMSLLSMNLINEDECGKLPLYRYCHNLFDNKVYVL